MDIEDSWRRRYRIDLESERFRLRPLIAGDTVWIAELQHLADLPLNIVNPWEK